ncbi:hypothetical protein AKJ16_DCAP11116 [Drosera capensis]
MAFSISTHQFNFIQEIESHTRATTKRLRLSCLGLVDRFVPILSHLDLWIVGWTLNFCFLYCILTPK